MKKINVLFLINHAGSGGTEKYIKLLCDNMTENINPILCYNEEGLLVSEFKERNLKTIMLKMNGPFDFKAAKRLKKIARDNHIDIVHTPYLRENYISIIAKKLGMKSKIVYTCHFNSYDNKKVTFMNKLFYRNLDKIISISSAVTDSLIASGASKEKIVKVFHGTTLKHDKDKSEVRKKFKVNQNEFVICSASRFSPEKGNMFLINAIKNLRDRKIENFKVLLANGGILFDECVKYVHDLGLDDCVTFLGYLKDDIDDLYKASDVYVTSSLSEGLGIAAIESLSYGIPNIVTNVGGLTDIVNEESNCGLVVEYDDADGLADAIIKLMNDKKLCETFSKNAIKVIENKFTINQMINGTLKVYNEVLK